MLHSTSSYINHMAHVFVGLCTVLDTDQAGCIFNAVHTGLAGCLFSLLLLSLIRRVFTQDCIASVATCLGVVHIHVHVDDDVHVQKIVLLLLRRASVSYMYTYTRLYCCDVPRCRTFTHCYSSVFCPAECQRDKTANQSSNNSAFTPNWLSAESRGGIRCIGGVISKHL